MAVNRLTTPNVISLEASGDLSTLLHRIVMVDDNGRVAVNTSNSTACLGVLLNKPSGIGQAARVAVNGSIVKCEAGAAINERDRIRAVTGGRGSATTTATDQIVGVALSAAAGSGALFELQVNTETG